MGRILILIPILLWGCVKNHSWQGTFYPEGCLTCESKYVYSPVFNTFKDCKNWADSRVKHGEDKASCGRNCEYQGKMDLSKCDTVVRSWAIPMLPESPTFSSYKE